MSSQRHKSCLQIMVLSKLKIHANTDFIKNSEDCGEEHFLKVDFQYSERLHDLYNDLRFLPKTMKIEKVEKNVANSHHKKEYYNSR